jgi:hypothetical protein
MEPPHLPTETLAASAHETAGKWFSPVPRITQMKPQARAISPLRAENPQRPDSLADDAVWSEPVSGRKFPVKQGKYREFSRFEPFFA